MGTKEFSHAEIRRYARHIVMPEMGLAGQRKLKNAGVLVIGIGGLGSPVALYLAAAGIGHLGLVDYDVVDESNLQRQIIHGQSTLGQTKLDSAANRIVDVNPYVQIERYAEPLTSANALRIFAPYAVIIDCTDNFPTRYLINDACVKLGKPNVYGSIFRFEGQLSVFFAQKGPCYRCLFPQPPPPGLTPSCAEAGVLGILPGTIGTMQATEAIKLIVGIGEPLIGRMILYDALEMSFTEIKIRQNPNCPVCSIPPAAVPLIDYEDFCGMPAHDRSDYRRDTQMQTISARELKTRLDHGDELLVLDVRNPPECEIAALKGALCIAKNDIQTAASAVLTGQKRRDETALAKVPLNREIVVLCRSGVRSAAVIRLLAEIGYDLNRLYNLDGGILAWAQEIDPSLPIY